LEEATTQIEFAQWSAKVEEESVPEGDEEQMAERRVNCGSEIVITNYCLVEKNCIGEKEGIYFNCRQACRCSPITQQKYQFTITTI
jgi:hypothetical protein